MMRGMGSKPKSPPPPPAPAPAAISRTMDAEQDGQNAMLRARRRSAYQKSFLTGPQASLGGGQSAGVSSFLG
jgi:hypothetical protein